MVSTLPYKHKGPFKFLCCKIINDNRLIHAVVRLPKRNPWRTISRSVTDWNCIWRRWKPVLMWALTGPEDNKNKLFLELELNLGLCFYWYNVLCMCWHVLLFSSPGILHRSRAWPSTRGPNRGSSAWWRCRRIRWSLHASSMYGYPPPPPPAERISESLRLNECQWQSQAPIWL